MQGGNEVVGFAFQHVVVHDQARRHQFRHSALDEAFGLFGIFELVAHGHFQPALDQLRQIRV